MRDFTLSEFKRLLLTFQNAGYSIVTVESFIKNPLDKCLILRHDVDRFPKNTVQMARLEAKLGIRSTYYFRIIPSVFQDAVLKAVVGYGHEVSYHYEDLTTNRGDLQKSIESFKLNLNRIRNYYPCKTICMHGSPISKWDNKNIWGEYDYKKFGIICDTSFDIDYNKVFYISDNGMGWNKFNTSVRDKVRTVFNIPIKNTADLISKIERGELPNQVMINAHPDTFFESTIPWIINYSFISSKNVFKRIVVKYGIFK